MLSQGDSLGVIVVGWAEPGPVSNTQEGLLKQFADQAVIAIENVRLFDAEKRRARELSEALEQQTATSEVLQVISSSPGQLEPVFEKMLANATRICEAKFGSLVLFDGNTYRRAALYNAPAAFVEGLRRDPILPLAASPVLSRLAKVKHVIHLIDILAEYPDEPIAKLGGARTIVVVPMFKEGALIGAINIFRQEVRSFTDKQIALVTNFADQAVIAIENTRLLNELRESAAAADRHRRRAQGDQPLGLRSADGARYAGRVGTRTLSSRHGWLFRLDGTRLIISSQATALRPKYVAVSSSSASSRSGSDIALGRAVLAGKSSPYSGRSTPIPN